MSEYKDPVKTKCGHIFCRECIDQSLQYNSLCPICKTAIKDVIGNQPNDGQMIVQVCAYDIVNVKNGTTN